MTLLLINTLMHQSIYCPLKYRKFIKDNSLEHHKEKKIRTNKMGKYLILQIEYLDKKVHINQIHPKKMIK